MGPGRDVLTGGAGRDIFVYRDAADGGDVIADFSHDQGDCINLSALDADILRDGRQSFTFSGCEPGSHAVWYESTEDGTGVYDLSDMDGDAKPDFFITLSGIYSLLLQDFIFRVRFCHASVPGFMAAVIQDWWAKYACILLIILF